MTRLAKLPFIFLCLLVLLSCSNDATAPPVSPVSITSYINHVYGAEYVANRTLPSADIETEISIVEADSVLGRGSTFSVKLSHEAGVRHVLLGVEGSVGYFLVETSDTLAATTDISGRLTAPNTNDFTLLCTARRADGKVFAPARHDLEVMSAEAVRYYISGVEGAVYIDADMPTPTRSATITHLEGDSVVVNGGSAAVTLTCIVPASAILIGAPNAFGHFRLPTSNLPGDQEVIIYLAQSAPANLVLHFLTEEPGPEYGPRAVYDPVVIQVGGGDVQVSLLFSPSQDVDLHLVEPGPTGEEIYWGHMTSEAGGTLDLDSNPACNLDHRNNENITYEDGTPLHGEYRVRVNYWESCDGGGADFRVVVVLRGEPTLYSGHFEANEAVGGAQGSGREICRFDF